MSIFRKFLLCAVVSISFCSLANAKNGVSIHAAYTYWLAGEEGLGLGRSGDFLIGDDPLFNSTTVFLTQPFKYESGFKAGASWENDSWRLLGEYTWVRNRSSINSSAPSTDPSLGTGVWLIAPWFFQIAGDGGSLSATQVDSSWRLKMDIADLTLGYCYTFGSCLTYYPYGGLRAAWIRQKLNLNITEPIGIFPTLLPQPIQSTTGSKSWAIGPWFGNNIHVGLGYGFRLEGDLGLGLLFTDYTKVFHREDPPSTDTVPGPLYAEIKSQHVLRAVLETDLGIGWNISMCCDRFQFDIAATYDFMLWWDQNMMRQFVNSLWNETPVNGNLYLHGLTISTCFSF